jgi:glycosyltransferase involved in cell wall biosynthesis
MKAKNIALFCPYLSSLGGGEKVALSVASKLAVNNKVDIISEKYVDLKQAFRYFNIDFIPDNISLKQAKYTNVGKHFMARFIPLPKIRFIFHHHYKFNLENNDSYDLFINSAYYSYLRPAANKSIYILMFPQEIKSLPADRPVISIIENWIIKKFFSDYDNVSKFITDYDLFLANSKFTASVAKHRWGISDNKLQVLYPICSSFMKKKKEKIIVSVGRIFPPDRFANNKNYKFMIDSFKKISFLHPEWRYVIIGTCSKQDRHYLQELIRMSRGYPIDIITNANQTVLEEYIGKSSILWHACGYPDIYNYPENKEHFGMSIVEAMSAGCVPVAYNAGGPKETVSGDAGILWNNQSELINNTSSLISQSHTLNKMALAAQKRSKHYNEDIFFNRIEGIIKEYI